MKNRNSAFLICGVVLTGCQSSAPELPQACALEPKVGQCRAAIPSYFYNSETEQCEEFMWGGCKGQVPFKSLSNCIKTCQVKNQTVEVEL